MLSKKLIDSIIGDVINRNYNCETMGLIQVNSIPQDLSGIMFDVLAVGTEYPAESSVFAEFLKINNRAAMIQAVMNNLSRTIRRTFGGVAVVFFPCEHDFNMALIKTFAGLAYQKKMIVLFVNCPEKKWQDVHYIDTSDASIVSKWILNSLGLRPLGHTLDIVNNSFMLKVDMSDAISEDELVRLRKVTNSQSHDCVIELMIKGARTHGSASKFLSECMHDNENVMAMIAAYDDKVGLLKGFELDADVFVPTLAID
jgi:hypothetical protein